MPLLLDAGGGLHLPPLEVPAELSSDDEVFVLRLTGEVCPDYDSYLAKLRQLRARVWECALTHRAGLTYEEALLSEQRSAKGVPQVGKRQGPNPFACTGLRLQKGGMCVAAACIHRVWQGGSSSWPSPPCAQTTRHAHPARLAGFHVAAAQGAGGAVPQRGPPQHAAL